MNKGHYIWNRAERVDDKLMPNVVIDAFNKWQKKQSKGLRFKSEKGRANALARIKRQKKQMDRQRRSRNRKILKQQQETNNNTLVLNPNETLTLDMLTDPTRRK